MTLAALTAEAPVLPSDCNMEAKVSEWTGAKPASVAAAPADLIAPAVLSVVSCIHAANCSGFANELVGGRLGAMLETSCIDLLQSSRKHCGSVGR